MIGAAIALVLLGWNRAAWAQPSNQTGNALQMAQVTSTATPNQDTITIKGTVSINEPATLPNNSILFFQLLDTKIGVVLGQQQYTTNGKQPPFQFEIEYDRIGNIQNPLQVVGYVATANRRVLYRGTSAPISPNTSDTVTFTLLPAAGTLPQLAGSGNPPSPTPHASIVFQYPKSLMVEEAGFVYVALIADPSITTTTILNLDVVLTSGKRQTITKTVELHPFMVAELSSPNFTITPSDGTSPMRDFRKRGKSEWSWTILTSKASEALLTLSVIGKDSDKSDAPVASVLTIPEKLHVDERPTSKSFEEFFYEGLTFVSLFSVGGPIAAIITSGIAIFQYRKNKKAEKKIQSLQREVRRLQQLSSSTPPQNPPTTPP
jgi:uncharacterized lipoprotein YbaY